LHDGDLPVTVAHIFGIPVEESFQQIAPIAAVTVLVLSVAARATIVRWRNRLRKR
jgi:hypothetical protein